MQAEATQLDRWLGTVDGTHPFVAVLHFLAWTLAFCLLLEFLQPVAGSSVMALVLLPAAVGGWYFGPLRGGAASLVLVGLTGALMHATAVVHGTGGAPAFGDIPGSLVTLAAGISVGTLRKNNVVLAAARSEIQSRLEERDRLAAALHLRISALEAAPIGIVITDPSGTIEWANSHLGAMTGYDSEELVGQHTRLLGSGRQPREFYTKLWDTVLSGSEWHGTLVNRRKDGSEYTEDMAITPVREGDGSIQHFVAAKLDVTKRTADEQRIRRLNASLSRHVSRLSTLLEIDALITTGASAQASIAAFAEAVRSGMGIDAVAVFLYEEAAGDLRLGASAGWTHPLPPELSIPLGSGVAGRSARERATIVLHGRADITQAIGSPRDAIVEPEAFELFASIPMIVRGRLLGVLQVAHTRPLAVDQEWNSTLSEIATQGAILIDNVALLGHLRAANSELRHTYDRTIEGWSRALDLRDKETEGHSRRVTNLALRLGRAMGLSNEQLVHMKRGGLLHDIGKMGVPDSILQKPGKLTDDEWDVMRRHTTLARDLLAPIPFLQPALEIPYSHHEWWDGSGYPEGLAGEAIPLAARIFAVADVYDALTSDRPYRAAWTRDEALEHIRESAGTHFDPEIVGVFLELEATPEPVRQAASGGGAA